MNFEIFFTGIVSIESTGILEPHVLFVEAIKVLVEKCDRILEDQARLKKQTGISK